MTLFGHSARRRIAVLGLLAVPLAVAGFLSATAAQGAGGGGGPSMEVLPSSTGLQYGQTVEVKGHNLPKGSGSVAVTICGLEDDAGNVIANPGADDCAGAPELGKLVVLKQWSSDGELDTNYTLPQSGQKFGTNKRYCDATHHCAVVVADANPDNPAYHVQVVIQFTDQQPFGGGTGDTTSTTAAGGETTTTAGGSTTTTTGASETTTTPTTSAPPTTQAPAPGSTNPPLLELHGSFSGSAGPSGGSFEFSGGGSINPPSTGSTPGSTAPSAPSLPPPTVPPLPAPVAQGLDQACTQLADAVQQAGGDPTALTVACSSIENGNGPQQLQLVLQNPSLLCIEGASLWQNNAQITDACNQTASALTPVTSQLSNALGPLLGG